MTQEDKDREAFEAWYAKARKQVHDPDGISPPTIFEAWLAGRDHYAPKLTEKEADANAIGMAMLTFHLAKVLIDNGVHPVTKITAELRAALRAAGVMFKEES